VPEQTQSTSSSESEALIRDFLNSRRSGVLATSDTSGNPHGSVVYFSVGENFDIIFATKTETQKYKNIQQNDQVAFVCYDEQSQTALDMHGRAEVATDPDTKTAALNAMFASSSDISKSELPPAEKLFAGEYVVLRLIPQVIRMAIYARPDAEANEELYETITFSPK